jgi:hypothetical protein
MTSSVLLDVPTRLRAFPQIFDRLVLILTVQAHLFGLIVIVQFIRDYRWMPACLALWVISLTVPIACLVVARRTGGILPTVPFVVAMGALLSVDVALTAIVPPSDRGGGAMWNWGVIGVTILGFAVFRPARDVLFVAAGHSVIAVAVTATALHQPGVGVFSLLIVANASLTPALAAAQYLNLYVRAVRLREQAVAERRTIQTRRAAEGAIEEDAARRLQALRAEVVPLLESLADGIVTADDPQVARLAHQIGANLRRELVAARSGHWLLLPSTATPGESKVRGVDLLDPNRCLSRLRDRERAALAVLLDALYRYSDWQRLSVVLTPEEGHPNPRGGPEAVLTTATITVVATGPLARAAAQDAAVAAAARQFDADLHLEMSNILVAETSLALLQLPPWPGGTIPSQVIS